MLQLQRSILRLALQVRSWQLMALQHYGALRDITAMASGNENVHRGVTVPPLDLIRVFAMDCVRQDIFAASRR